MTKFPSNLSSTLFYLVGSVLVVPAIYERGNNDCRTWMLKAKRCVGASATGEARGRVVGLASTKMCAAFDQIFPVQASDCQM